MLSNGILWIYSGWEIYFEFYLAVSMHYKYLHYFLIILIQRYYRFTTRSFHSHKFASHFTISFHISLVISHTTKSNQMIWLCICYVQITKPTNQVNPIIYLSCPITNYFYFILLFLTKWPPAAILDGTTMSIIELVRDIWMSNACVKNVV